MATRNADLGQKLEHPNGAVQGICSAAVGLLALLIAFIGYTSFNSASAGKGWQPYDIVYVIVGLFAAAFLVTVPWLATRACLLDRQVQSINEARIVYLIGAALAVISMIIFVTRDFYINPMQNA